MPIKVYSAARADSPADIVQEDGLRIEFLETPVSCRRHSVQGDLLSVHYTGRLEDGTIFDSSYDRKKPIEFVVGINCLFYMPTLPNASSFFCKGEGQVIKGWDEGLMDACTGEKRRLTIPPSLGYGEKGAGGGVIPPGATLVFEVLVVNIQDGVQNGKDEAGFLKT